MQLTRNVLAVFFKHFGKKLQLVGNRFNPRNEYQCFFTRWCKIHSSYIIYYIISILGEVYFIKLNGYITNKGIQMIQLPIDGSSKYLKTINFALRKSVKKGKFHREECRTKNQSIWFNELGKWNSQASPSSTSFQLLSFKQILRVLPLPPLFWLSQAKKGRPGSFSMA